MSDESQPPPLRLKPRVSTLPETPPVTGGESTPPEPADTAATPATTDTEAPRLRLKPKAVAETASESAPPPSTLPPTASPNIPAEPAGEPARPRLKPRLSSEQPPTEAPASAAMPAEPPPLFAPAASPASIEGVPTPEPAPSQIPAEAARFKLKPKAPSENSSSPSPVPAVPSADPAALVAPATATPPVQDAPVPSLPEAAAKAPRTPPPPISVDVSEELAVLASKRPEEKPAFRIGLLVTAVLAVAVLGGGGYFAYRTFLAAPAAGTAASAKSGTTAATASAVLKKAENKARGLASVPGQLIDKAQDALAARRGNEQDRVDTALEGRDYDGERALKTRTPDEITEHLGKAEPAPTPERTVVHLDLGSSSTPPPSTPAPAMEVAEPAVAASPAFKTFVTSARISGVFQGNPPRALINGRTVRPGDILDTALGVFFERIDANRKLVFFKDQTGAILAKKY